MYIDAIIFDFGGVILNIDHELTERAFYSMGVKDFGSLYSHGRQSELFVRLETGSITAEAFRDAIRLHADAAYTNDQIDVAWNAMLLDIPAGRIHLLEKLKKRYRTFLLSNTNEIHYNAYIETLRKNYPYKDFSGLFEKTYFSFQCGMRKPDKDFYNSVIASNNLDPGKTLFIDDSIQNIRGAASCGLLTLHHSPADEIEMYFDVNTHALIL